MSKVEELLEKYNPDGVPNKLLVECSLIDYGYPFTSSMFTDDSSYIPIIRIRDVKPGKASTYYMGNYSKEYIVKRGDILVGMDGEFNLEKWNDIDSLLNQRVARITEMPSKSTKGYLYHILGPIFKKIEREISGGSVKHLSVKIINSISIPLPHIKVQEEIVKILDSFTNLIDALNEELSLRQKQFEYYREKLLTFGDNCDYVSISPIRGKRVVKDDLNDNNKYPVYQNSIEALGYYDKVNRRSNMTFIICAGAAGEIGFSTSEFWAADDCFTINHDDLLDKFIYYCIYVKKHYLKSQVRKASVPRLSNTVLSKLKLPCPPLAVQQSIVEKLDAFESLISSLKEEIALRQKQYEYYREKLLTFD